MIKKLGLVFALSILVLNAKEVTVSILPQKYFVKKIALDKISVNVMVKEGFSPATYEPKVSQMRKLSKSEIYFSIGVPFEKSWLNKFKNANKDMIFVDTSLGINKLEMKEHKHHDEHEEDKHHDEHKEDKHHDEHEEDKHHDEHEEDKHHDEHEEEKHHDHGGIDPHVWLDPILVKTQAKNIYEAIIKIDKENIDFYTKNYKNFLEELNILDEKLKNILKPYSNKAFMVFHPSWGYFSNRYNLEQIAIEVEGKEPKPSQLIDLVKEAKLHNIKILFVSPQFSKKGAETIAKSLKGKVTIIDPLSYNWEDDLIKTANEIANIYK